MPEFADYQKHLFQKKTIDGVAKLIPIAGNSSGGASECYTPLHFDVPFNEIPEEDLAKVPVGQFITCKIPGSQVGQDELTSAQTIYVGGSGAGDTLIDGRGIVPELPFERLSVAVENTLKKNYSHFYNYIIQGDVEDNTVINLDMGYLHINKAESLQQKPKIVTNRIFLDVGRVRIYGIDIEKRSDISNAVIGVANSGFLEIDNCNIKASSSSCVSGAFGGIVNVRNCSLEVTDGSYAISSIICGTAVLSGSLVINGKFRYGAINSDRSSSMLFEDGNVTISGNVDGAKYYVSNGSVINLMGVSEDSLPGTLAGACDTSSKVIA